MNYHSFDIFTDVVELLNSYMAVNKTKYFENAHVNNRRNSNE